MKIFIPDQNLGSFVAEQVPEKNIILNDGCCPIHARITAEQVKCEKDRHPDALVLTHPECDSTVVEMSDFVGSTSGIIDFAKASACKEFIICTEDGVDYKLVNDNPDKHFYYPNPHPCCADMKLNTLEAVLSVLEKEDREITVDRGTREGAHSRPRILFHADETGKEITMHLLETAKSRKNITLVENFTMVDLICYNSSCYGIVGHDADGKYTSIAADYTVLATGGIGGLFQHSTNYRHLTGDALALALKYHIKLQHIDYIQIHPITLYTKKHDREFLISESVRGEGAILLNSMGERFVNELLPRDVVTNAIFEEMKKEGSEHVWLSLAPIPEEEIRTHFPNIYQKCLDEGYDITKEPIPVVPSQHYFMGGIDVDCSSRTSMERLYAVGETACNGVHGRNRLASNSLLESLVFAKRAAKHIIKNLHAI